MGDNYYDNSDIKADENGIVFVDRVYCIDFNSFNKALWERLGEVYSLLPHKIDTDYPHWYGIEGKDEFYLSTSVEPSGLQVSGELKEVDWIKWESTFAKYLNDFPLFEV